MLRVALVDDVPEMRTIMRVGLRLAGMEVVAEASDGQSAVRGILESAPDVVVLDRRLPDFSGDEVFRLIRAAGSAAKVIIYSGAEPAPLYDESPPPLDDPYVIDGADFDSLLAAIHRVHTS